MKRGCVIILLYDAASCFSVEENGFLIYLKKTFSTKKQIKEVVNKDDEQIKPYLFSKKMARNIF